MLYFTYLREAPTQPFSSEGCIVDDVCDVITCAKFEVEIYRGSNFRFSY